MITQQKQPSTQPPVSTSNNSKKVAPAIWRRSGIGTLWQQTRKTLKGRFILLTICIVVLALAQALFFAHSFQQASSDLDTINSGSIPSVNAAQTMAQYLEDIDAKSADYLATAPLTTTVPCSIVGTTFSPGPLTVHDCDDRNISAEIVLANQQLYLAIHNVTYPGERTATERITTGFEDYVGQIAIMRYEYDLATSKTNTRDVHMQNAHKAYLAANAILTTAIVTKPTINAAQNYVYDEKNLPSCKINGQSVAPAVWPLGGIRDNLNCLSDINYTHLSAAYDDTTHFLGYTVVLSIVLILFSCMLIFGTTGYMAFMTHRVINPGLTFAVLISIIFSIASVSLLAQSSGRHGAFGQMVKDDYDSIYYAALLKKYGTSANADESRWLIAMEFNDQAEAAHWQQDWVSNTAQVEQLMRRAVSNRTWPQEDQPLADMQASWNRYYQIDGTIRSTARSGNIVGAEKISTGVSNTTFSNFTDAVDRLSQANLDHYNITLNATQGALSLYIFLSAILFPLIGLCAVWGIARRLRDF
ncbi:MAG: MCP four helix bundle domain-containing protein [Ktedonobacteraceae bacterium]|nr:MCP four helix bundle domain-containing protein [Ktedonobacteraceae bacterium]